MIVSAKIKYQGADGLRELACTLAPLGYAQLALSTSEFQPHVVAAVLASSGLRVSHIHGPRIKSETDIEALLPPMLELAGLLSTEWVLFHLPGSVSLRSLQKLFRDDLQVLCDAAECGVLWETGHGDREVARITELLGGLPAGHAMCIDTNHCAKSGYDVAELFRQHHAVTPVIHASNRSSTDPRANGLPLFDPEGMLDFEKLLTQLCESGWDGELNLEYHSPYRYDVEVLRRDAEAVRGVFCCS